MAKLRQRLLKAAETIKAQDAELTQAETVVDEYEKRLRQLK